MTIHARPFALHGLALAGLLLLAACGKQDNQTATTPPSAGSTPAPAAAQTAPAPAVSAPAPAATAAAPAAAGTSATAMPAPASVFKVDQVQMGEAVTGTYKIARPTTSFDASQNTIYASVATTGTTTGATLSAHFSYLEGKGQDVTTISQTIATDGPATTTFKLRNPNNWPAGKYKVEIAIDGKPAASQTFEVKAA